MDERELSAAYDARHPLFDTLAQTLTIKTQEALEGVPHIDRVSFRVKAKKSFVTKAGKPKYCSPLVEMEDQVAGRVLTFFRDDLATVQERLVSYFGAVEHTIKEPAEAKQFDYESVHLVFVIAEHHKPVGWSDQPSMPSTFEMQLRTLFMHAWAEPQHDLGYKGSGLDRQTERELAWVAASAWGADRTLNDIAKRLVDDDEKQCSDLESTT